MFTVDTEYLKSIYYYYLPIYEKLTKEKELLEKFIKLSECNEDEKSTLIAELESLGHKIHNVENNTITLENSF